MQAKHPVLLTCRFYPAFEVDVERLVANEQGWHVEAGVADAVYRWRLYSPNLFVYIKEDGRVLMRSFETHIKNTMRLVQAYPGEPTKFADDKKGTIKISSVQLDAYLEQPFEPLMVREEAFSLIRAPQGPGRPWLLEANRFRFRVWTSRVMITAIKVRFPDIDTTWRNLLERAKTIFVNGTGLGTLDDGKVALGGLDD